MLPGQIGCFSKSSIGTLFLHHTGWDCHLSGPISRVSSSGARSEGDLLAAKPASPVFRALKRFIYSFTFSFCIYQEVLKPIPFSVSLGCFLSLPNPHGIKTQMPGHNGFFPYFPDLWQNNSNCMMV